MPLEDVINEAREKAIREAVDRLSGTELWKQRKAMGRLYMLCLELDISHNKLYPRLKQMGITL